MSDTNEPDVPAADATAEPAAPAVDPTPVAARQPSSDSATQQPEQAPEREPVSLEDAARAVVIFVKAHRTVGDADLGAALADLEAALPAQES